MCGQVKILQDLGDALAPLGLGHVLGEAQLSGVLEGLADSEGRVDDVALGDHADLVAHDRVVLVHVQPVEEHLALLGLLLAGEGLEQRRLPGSRRADDGQQLVARQREGDAVEQRHAAVVDPEGQVLTHQLAAGSAGDLDLAQTVRAQGDEGRSQTHQHGLGDLDLRHALPGDVQTVGGSQVGDDHAVGGDVDTGVVLGDERVIQDQGVVGRAPDGARGGDAEGLERVA